MDTYSLLREIADSWVLLAMFLFFAGVVIWAFLPSLNAERKDASLIPFRNDDDTSCSGTCETCQCKSYDFIPKGQADV